MEGVYRYFYLFLEMFIMKLYNVTVFFDGCINYEIGAESTESATRQAIDLFNDENSDIIAEHLRKPLVKDDCEIEPLGEV